MGEMSTKITIVSGKWKQMEMQLYCKMAFGVTHVDGASVLYWLHLLIAEVC